MTSKTPNAANEPLGVRSLIFTLACFLFARWLFYPTWGEALAFTVVMAVFLAVISYVYDMVVMAPPKPNQQRIAPSLHEENVRHRPPEFVSPPNEQESLEELKVFFIGPGSAWQKAVAELARRRLEIALRYKHRLADLEVARQREDDELVMAIESQVDRLKMHQRDLHEAEAVVLLLMDDIGAIIDSLSRSLTANKPVNQNQWDKPVVATLGKLHGLVKQFPLTPPQEGEDAKLIHYNEELESATTALNALRVKAS